MEDALDLRMEILADREVAVVRCRGKLRFGKEAQLLRQCVESIFSEFSTCVLSLNGIHQIDARGIGTLIGCLERARSLGCLLLIGGASTKVRQLLHLMKLNDVLELYATESDALGACRQAA